MPGIGAQRSTVEHVCKHLLAERNRLRLIGLVQPVGGEGVLGGLDDEGGGVVVEFVDMRLKPAMFGLLEIEGEGVIQPVGAEPDIAVGAHHQIGREIGFIAVADFRVDAVRGDDQIGIGKFQIAVHIALEDQLNAEFLAAGLENVEQLLAANADEAVPGGADFLPLEPDLDIVPVVEGNFHLRRRFGIRPAHGLHHLIGKDDTPAEGVIGQIALDDRDGMRRVTLLHQKSEIQTRRAATDTHDPHRVFLRHVAGCRSIEILEV